MTTTQKTLESISANLDESMGVRKHPANPRLSPIADPKNIGRKPVRHISTLEVDRIIADPDQPRKEFDEESLERLAASIEKEGQFHPILVRWSAKHDRWIIIAGERRWRATQRAGIKLIDGYCREGGFTKAEVLSQQIIENSLREDLKPLEQARAFKELMTLNDWTAKDLATAIHVQPSTISRSLSLLKLPHDIQQQIERGLIPARSAHEISKIKNEGRQKDMAQKVANQGLSHRDIQRQRKQKPTRRRHTKQTFVTEGGWKVVVSAKRKGNYHEIEQALKQTLDEVRHRIDNGIRA